MRSGAHTIGVSVAALLLGTAQTFAAPPAFALQPYQMMRSLQLIQDRVANGDSAALPMQSKLLQMIDRRLQRMDAKEFETKRNFQALMMYAMSGGNPRTAGELLGKAKLGAADRNLADGVMGYIDGHPSAALAALENIDPLTQQPELGAFIALVKGSVIAPENPTEALKALDEARLLAPGTLIEEAALRRSIAIAAKLGDVSRFRLASNQYIRRFLHSPYAGQFADTFVSAVIDLHSGMNIKAVDSLLAGMDADHRRFLYLRLARASTIAGLTELAVFASQKAEPGATDSEAASDPRPGLYANIAAVTSGDVGKAMDRLKAIDPNTLDESDRHLLDAALDVAREVTARSAMIADSGASSRRPVEGGAPAVTPPVTAEPETASLQATKAMVAQANEQLESIDKLLQDHAQ